ncbi:MAG: CYTH domain-containing protein [Candidatus Paceibacterota bacterium]|jgi:adenylate cyclase class IV
MIEEKEIKIKVDKNIFDEAKKYIKEHTKLTKTKFQIDEYFDTELFMFTNLNRGIRVRYNDKIPESVEFKSLFWNKYGNPNNPWYIEEIGLKIPLDTESKITFRAILKRFNLSLNIPEDIDVDYQLFKDLLNKIGLSPRIIVTKEREEYENDESTFVFDYIKELGYFIEIETKGIDPMDILKTIPVISDYSVVRNGYNDMVGENIPNLISNDIRQQLFRLNHSWNILETEVDIVNQLLKEYKEVCQTQ